MRKLRLFQRKSSHWRKKQCAVKNVILQKKHLQVDGKQLISWKCKELRKIITETSKHYITQLSLGKIHTAQNWPTIDEKLINITVQIWATRKSLSLVKMSITEKTSTSIYYRVWRSVSHTISGKENQYSNYEKQNDPSKYWELQCSLNIVFVAKFCPHLQSRILV